MCNLRFILNSSSLKKIMSYAERLQMHRTCQWDSDRELLGHGKKVWQYILTFFWQYGLKVLQTFVAPIPTQIYFIVLLYFLISDLHYEL